MPKKETNIVQINATHPESDRIRQAAALIQHGDLVVFPTETVYGLGADALQSHAVEQIFAAKARPYSDPLIVHIAEESDILPLVQYIPDAAKKLMPHFWPGPLTLIFPASARVPRLVTAGLETVAIRMPAHPVAQALIRQANTPIAAPSANRFMHISPTTAQHAFTDLQNRVSLILDGGSSMVGVESTVLDICANPPVILRPGGISLEALQSVLPDVQPPRQHIPTEAEEQAQSAPGQMLVHYSPGVPTFLYEGAVSNMRSAMLTEIQRRRGQGEQVGILVHDADVDYFQHSGAAIYALGSTAEQAATKLYAGLRVLEETEVHVILCRSFPTAGIGLALQDRLRKAAGGKIISS
ncbi:MAG TPA: L-threonylcarbamoyladenylate synthase [Dictyobacter sp.]|nr:L-threonylcarbamoyladenylate synthase [Dictyobacter sp.]